MFYSGHSLGGLYARYVIGALQAGGYFEHFTPVNFVVVASPQMGSRQQAQRFGEWITQTVCKLVLRRTGVQMILADQISSSDCSASSDESSISSATSATSPSSSPSGSELKRRVKRDVDTATPSSRDQVDSTTISGWDPLLVHDHPTPLLLRMTRGVFLAALRRFSVRRLYANISGDLQVHYCTSSIRAHNPYKGLDNQSLPRLPKYPLIVDFKKFKEIHKHRAVEDEKSSRAFRHDKRAAELREMLHALNSVGWHKHDVVGRPILAHTDVVVKSRCLNKYGSCVVYHLVDHLAV